MEKGRSAFKAWVEAMRLRTLPVSVAGVITAAGCAAYVGKFNVWPWLICLFFAVGAQIVSNFANEYFDFKNGLDRKGREGFRRGVTEGDLSPTAMRNATFGLLAVVCLLGCSLIYWGGWELIFIGIAVAAFAIGYSTGPYPLSHHGLGEIAVIVFFGLVPVYFTTYLQTGIPVPQFALWMGLGMGFMGANVLIVNNRRDMEDDRKVGKKTLAVRFGAKAMARLYLVNGFLALLFFEIATAMKVDYIWQLVPLIYINQHWIFWQKFKEAEGSEFNQLLGKTAGMMPAMGLWAVLALTIGKV